MGLISSGTKWITKRWQRTVALGLGLAAALFGLFLILYFLVIPVIVRKMVISQSELVEGTLAMEKWKNPKYKMQFKVFVFSVRNPDEVLKGATPIVKETGPYTFDKTMHHEVSSSGNGTVTFKRKVLYHFNEADSCQTCFLGNRIWVPNLIYQKMVEVASKPAMRAAATTLLAQTPFLELEVEDLLFKGYKDPFLENFCSVPFVNVVCETIFALPERIGLFYGFNDSYIEGEYTIKDGTFDITQRGDVIAFNGMDQLKKAWWDDDQARILRGSEGSLFHPFINRDETLYTLSSLLCRVIPLNYLKDSEWRGIPTYRFTIPPTAFDGSANPGYCHHTDKILYPQQNDSGKHCYPRGVQQISKCRPNEPPVVISYPNFNMAPEELRKSVIGLNETDDERDSISVDVEPTLGMPVRAQRRVQLNVEFWAGSGIFLPAYHTKQVSTLIPIATIHDDAEIDDDTLDKVNSMLIMGQRLAYGACYLLGILALLTLIGTLLYALFKSGILRRNRDHIYSSGGTVDSEASSKSIVPPTRQTNYI